MQKQLLLFSLLLAPFLLFSQPKIQLVQFASGFSQPVDIAHCGDSRLFVVEKKGIIWILDSLGNRLPDPFLNIDPLVKSTNSEQGLLGLAFPPNFDSSGFFYVYYTRETDGDNRLSRFSRIPGNPNAADPNSELIYFTQDDPYVNHNGGCLKFGPDGYLYISLGDGGSGGDPQNNGQKKTTFLGKMLRLDVDSASNGLNYSIPPDNPFVNDPSFYPEIWSYGWRNAWRYSFDRLTGDLWIGEVGQDTWEEIDFEPANTPGRNYGWRCYEGTHTYNTSGCQGASAYTPPIYEYNHSAANGCSVTGGFIYRGSQYPDLYGRYVFADYCSGRFWQIRPNANGTFTTQILANLTAYEYSAFGEDKNGELYVAGYSSGKIYKIKELCSPFQISGQVEQQNFCTGTFAGIIKVQSTGGAGTVNYAWSNGQPGDLIVYLEAGDYVVTATDGNGCVRVDTFTMTNLYTDPPLPAIEGDSVYHLCAGQSLTLTATTPDTGSYVFNWWRDEAIVQFNGGPQLSVTQAGQYYVQAANPDGFCTSDPSDTVTVVLEIFPAPEVSIVQGAAVLCPNDSAVLGVTGVPAGYSYQWFDGDQALPGADGPQLTVTQGGLYSVEISGQCGEAHSADLVIDQELAIIPLIALQADSLFVLSASDCNGCQWYLNGVALPGATGPYHIAAVDGIYALEISSPNGCKYRSAEIEVLISNTILPASVKSFSLAPNPTTDKMLLTLEMRRNEKLEVSMSDEKGQRLFFQTPQTQLLSLPIDLHALPAGTYLLTVKTESGVFTRQVVKI